MITELKKNEVFVFGSNLAGIHGAGAARQARVQFGAKLGVGEGMTGRCYAFPTLDQNFRQLTVEHLVRSRDRLYATCDANPKLVFLLTKVGCGLAHFSESLMMELFSLPPANLILPEDWRRNYSKNA